VGSFFLCLGMKRIAIDMDDVMADTTRKIVSVLNHRMGKQYTFEELEANAALRQSFYADYQKDNAFLWEPGFFSDIPVMPNAQAVVKSLCDHYEVFVVSAATEFPHSLKEKMDWLKAHFPFISWTHTVFCGHKYMIQADYLIDDHERNLKTFTGEPILFSAPHNLHLIGYDRVKDWSEVAARFL